MATSNKNLLQKVETASQATPIEKFKHSMDAWYAKKLPDLIAFCGDEKSAKKLYAGAMFAISKSADLLQCDKQSLANCIMTSAALGLYPGPMQECSYVKFGKDATFIPMYQGLIKLMLQSGHVSTITANVVYEKDYFDYEEGLEQKLRHKKFLGGNPGTRVCAYAAAVMTNGQKVICIMAPDEIEAVKRKSKASGSSYSPWNTDEYTEDEMWKKTVIKRLAKLLPKSVETAQAIEHDNNAERPDLAKKPIVNFHDHAEVEAETFDVDKEAPTADKLMEEVNI